MVPLFQEDKIVDVASISITMDVSKWKTSVSLVNARTKKNVMDILLSVNFKDISRDKYKDK
jgi:hypothetical protein